MNVNDKIRDIKMCSSKRNNTKTDTMTNDISVKAKPLFSSRRYRVVKRILDLVFSALTIVALAPLMLLICILIRIDSKGPAVFIHYRIGKNGKPLPLYKFRSMYVGAEAMIADFTPEQRAEWEQNFKLDHDPRITRMGNFLRRTSLDELPQLFNIFVGDLSFVGPRPVVTAELELYGENKEKFLSVTPGLTGYWQAYARSSCTYEQRMEMELYYVDNANLLWDFKIIFATVGAVITGRGAK